MRAAVMRNHQLVVDDIPEPKLTNGEVLVKTLACGICGSDLHTLIHGKRMMEEMKLSGASTSTAMDLNRDVVMGHEFCAEILDYGPNVQAHIKKAMPIGTRVCSMPMTLVNGAPLAVGYSNDRPGGYGERMALHESMLLKVPNGLDTARAALTEPLAVGFHALQMARIQADDVPLVIGCGPIGLAVINALRMADVRPIIAADFSARRRQLAEQLGADIVIDPREHSPYESWAQIAAVSKSGTRMPINPLSGAPTLRPGVFFECVGVPGVLDQMMVGAQRGCRFVIVGVCMEQDHIRPLLAINKELNLQFVLAYTAEEFAQTLHNIAEGRLLTDPLLTGRVGVEGVAAAFRDLASPEQHAKILVEPWR